MRQHEFFVLVSLVLYQFLGCSTVSVDPGDAVEAAESALGKDRRDPRASGPSNFSEHCWPVPINPEDSGGSGASPGFGGAIGVGGWGGALLGGSTGGIDKGFGGSTGGVDKVPGPVPVLPDSRDIWRLRPPDEGDIVRIVGNTVYVLNQYRGLNIIDLRDSANPRLLSQLDLTGVAIDGYVRGGYLFAVLAGFSTGSGPIAKTSELVVISIQNSRNPRIVTRINLGGVVLASKIVGSILYAVSSASEAGYSVESIQLGEPDAPRLLAQLAIARERPWSFNVNALVHFTDEQLYLIDHSWDHQECQSTPSQCLRLVQLDISANNGAIRTGNTVFFPGRMANPYSIDRYQGTLRVVTNSTGFAGQGGSGGGGGSGGKGQRLNVDIRTFDARSTANLTPLGTLSVTCPDQYPLARLDGPRAYVAGSAFLVTVDLTDLQAPRLASRFEDGSAIAALQPLQDRLLTLGYELDSGTQMWKLNTSMFDVNSLDRPTLLSRQAFGEDLRRTPEVDSYAVANLNLIERLGLFLVPIRSTRFMDGLRTSFSQGFQVFEFDRGATRSQGRFMDTGQVLRAFGSGHEILTVSDSLFLSIGVQSPEHPSLKTSLALSRNVLDVSPAGRDNLLELVVPSEFSQSLFLVPRSLPNQVPLDQADILDTQRFLPRGDDGAFLSFNQWDHSSLQWVGGGSRIELHDRSTFPGSEPVAVGADRILLRSFSQEPLASSYRVLDYSDPDHPAASENLTIPDVSPMEFGGEAQAVSSRVFFEPLNAVETIDGITCTRNYVAKIDFQKSGRPELGARYNIPGWYRGAKGDYIFTADMGADGSTRLNSLYTSARKAYLRSIFLLESGATGLVFSSNHIYYVSDSHLGAVDLSAPEAPRIAWRTPITRAADGYSTSLQVLQQHAFVVTRQGWAPYSVELSVFDLRDPETPRLQHRLLLPIQPHQIRVIGDTAFIVLGSYRVQTVDLRSSHYGEGTRELRE